MHQSIATGAVASILLLCTACGQREATPPPATSTSATTTNRTALEATVLGTWTWSNHRQGVVLDVKIPESYRAGTQDQTVQFLPTGRAILTTAKSMPPEPAFQGSWGATWAVDPHRDSSLELTLDPIPEAPGPHVGVKGKMMVRFKVEQVNGISFLVRPIDDGYLTFLKQAP